MTQIAIPDGLGGISTWASVPGGSLWTVVDEISADDADYVESVSNPSAEVVEFSLTDPVDPVLHTGHSVNYRYGKSASGGRQIDITISLRQGASTEIAAQTHANVGAGFTTGVLSLTPTQAGNITDYSDLRIRVMANAVGGGSGRTGRISWAQVQLPSPRPGRLTLLGVGV